MVCHALVGSGPALIATEIKKNKKKANKSASNNKATNTKSITSASVGSTGGVEATPLPVMMADDQASTWARN